MEPDLGYAKKEELHGKWTFSHVTSKTRQLGERRPDLKQKTQTR